MDTKTCIKCNTAKNVTEFYVNRTARTVYRRTTCIECDKVARRSRSYNRNWKETRVREKLAERRRRRDPKFTAKHIVRDSRSSDKKKNRVNDLDRAWVSEKISHGCEYCGETELRMTLDRMDNVEGHTKDNVVAACIRCNYLRRDLPYAAWLLLLDGVEEARVTGAFGDWTGRCR
jgi:hypothetical protein